MAEVLQISCVQMHWARLLEFNLRQTLEYIRSSAQTGSRVVLFPEANLTGYYFPFVIDLNPSAVSDALGRYPVPVPGQWVEVGFGQCRGYEGFLAHRDRQSFLHRLIGDREVIHIQGRGLVLLAVGADADLHAVVDGVREHQRLSVGVDELEPILP
jgi:hypothetical protein